VLPSRLGIRFALEALFLLLLAIGAGLADLRPLLIVVVVGVGWILVALIEITADRIARSPVTYLLPPPMEVEHEESPRVFMPRPEERTVVAPPEPEPDPEIEEEPAVAAHVPEFEPQSEPEPMAEKPESGPPTAHAPEPLAEAEPEPIEESVEPRQKRRFLHRREAEPEHIAEAAPEAVPEPEPEPVAEAEPEAAEEPVEQPRRKRRFFRRSEPEVEEEVPEPPRHVKLLPRRSEPESSPVSREVAELFGDDKREESGG